MDSQKLKLIFILAASGILAIYLGISAATAQTAAIAWVLGGFFLVFILALGKHVWALIPIGIAFSSGLNFLPTSPRLAWLAMFVTLVMFGLRFAVRRTNEFTWRWNLLDLAILLHLIAIGQAFVRNPVGLSILGGSEGMVGGKAYFIHFFAIICYVLMGMVRGKLSTIRIVVILMICCSFLDGAVTLLGSFVPAIAAIGIQFYGGFSFSAANTGVAMDASEGRVTEGKGLGESLGIAALTVWRPLSAINPNNIIPFSMLAIAGLGIAVSGFRSSAGMIAIYFIVGSLIRRKFADIMIAGMVAVLGICFLAIIGLEKFPNGVQRVLSVLPIPGLVDEDIADYAQKSTDWRVEMWKLALTSDRYIHDKMFGDGFGTRADELAAQIDAAFGDKRKVQGLSGAEVMMERGSFHGFHVQTIRMTGYFGLLMALITLGIFFRHAWSHIKYFRGRPEWGFILFICTPFLIHPFYVMLVFGDYSFGFPEYLVMAGFLKMLWNVRAQEAREFAYQRQLEASEAAPQQVQWRERSVTGLPAPAMKAR